MRGGGVMVYVSEVVKSMRRHDLEEEGMEIVWIQIKMSKRSLLIGNVYRPPDAPAVWMDGLEAMLERVVQEKLDVVLLGDLNCNLLKPDHRAVRLGMVVSEYGFTQMVSGSTRVTQSSKTQIDLLFVTNPNVMKSCGCRELGLSDHNMIYGVLTESIVRQNQCLRQVRCFRNVDLDTLVEDLKLAPWHVMDTFDDINCQWEFWKNLFKSVIDSLIPLKKARVRKRTLPWISQDIRVLMRARNYYCKKAKRSKLEEDWVQYRSLRNLVTKRLRKEKLRFFEDVSKEAMKNPRKAWKELNRLVERGKGKKIEVVRTGEGVITDKKDIADEFCIYVFFIYRWRCVGGQ